MDWKKEPIALLIIRFGAHVQKIWLLVALNLTASKPNFTK
jgi:hypothetical protein